jgi:hypothetical protein
MGQRTERKVLLSDMPPERLQNKRSSQPGTNIPGQVHGCFFLSVRTSYLINVLHGDGCILHREELNGGTFGPFHHI